MEEVGHQIVLHHMKIIDLLAVEEEHIHRHTALAEAVQGMLAAELGMLQPASGKNLHIRNILKKVKVKYYKMKHFSAAENQPITVEHSRCMQQACRMPQAYDRLTTRFMIVVYVKENVAFQIMF